ncbi:GNAT family N-acetyltransferase [Sporocytophaga myxococcoides]|uniref:GNAT family N-acetyltransferase n=1 Tax=Sporocytophaga myxococcoides TaxID=153721 RepID=UPI00048C6894|nr:GNAT family protein [Sporocytophaga myxococcoides]
MITFEPFTPDDFDRLISWIENEEDLMQFAGPYFSYPLTKSQLDEYVNSKDRKPLKIKLTESGEYIGHCELNYTNKIPRLSRILIGQKESRNKGIGLNIVRGMIDQISQASESNVIELIVYDWNVNAINCYKKAGFYIRDNWEDIISINNKQWRAVSMYLELRNKQ